MNNVTKVTISFDLCSKRNLMIICNVSGSNGVLNGGYETIRSFVLVK